MEKIYLPGPLEESKLLLEKVLTCIQESVFIIDTYGRILFVNFTVKKMFYYECDELTDKNIAALFTPEDIPYLYTNLLSLSRYNKSFEGEIMVMRKDSSRFFAYMHIQPCTISDTEAPMIIITITDIDRLKKLERDPCGTKYEDLIKVADGVAHELRNPIVSISGFADRLYKSCASLAKNDEYYSSIVRNVKKIEDLVRKIEDLVRIPSPILFEVKVIDIINKAITTIKDTINLNNVNINVEPTDAIIKVDPALTTKVLCVIINNAIDALTDSKDIFITSQCADNGVSISVRDTGSGIPDKNLHYIFNPFFTTKADGAGLELSIAKKVMEVQGGSIEVHSREGEGSTFTLLFIKEKRRKIRVSILDEKDDPLTM